MSRLRSFSFHVAWTISLDGEFAFVREDVSDKRGFVVYGPMPRDWSGPFVDERKEYFETIRLAQLKRLTDAITPHG